jgi:hypothetical protein
LIELAEKGLEEGVGPAAVGVGKGGPGHGLGPEMVELLARGVHAHDPVGLINTPYYKKKDSARI